MMIRRRDQLAAPLLVLTAFVGVWVGHTIEYLRVAGGAGVTLGLLRPTHAYMLPAGALLLGLTLLAGRRLHRMWIGLGRRLDLAGVGMAAALRGRLTGAQYRRLTRPTLTSEPSRPSRVLGLWLALAAVQIGLYALQENLEAAFTGLPMPGLAAIGGVHWAAPLIHVAVALVLALAVAAFFSRVATRVRQIIRAESLVRELWRRIRRVARPLAPVTPTRPRLTDFGARLWSRPPPSFSAA